MTAPAKLMVHNVGELTMVNLEEPRWLDALQIDQLGKELYRLIDDMDRRQILVDFTKVQFLASSAVGVLVNLRNKVNERKGTLVICGMQPHLMRVFEIMNLTKVFTFCANEKEAMRVFGFPT